MAPASEGNELLKLAKEKAKMATQQGATPQTQIPSTRSTTLSIARPNEATPSVCQRKSEVTPKRVDAALPGKHTRQLYDRLAWREARVLAQLGTGMARLNAYLHRIKVASDRSVRMWASERDSGAFPLPMQKVDGPSEQRCCDVRTHKRQHFLPPWREITGR